MSDFSPFGVGLFGDSIEQRRSGVLSNKFKFPPFSVLNARDGDWQARKRAWISLGIKSELGRGAAITRGITSGGQGTGEHSSKDYIKNAVRKKKRGTYGVVYAIGNKIKWEDQKKKKGVQFTGCRPHGGSVDERPGREPGTSYVGGDAWVGSQNGSGTSIFDPVLCELCYRWFCPAGGQIVDPFAGGSVRGLVAGLLGYRYWGCDLNANQIAANEEQRDIAPDADIQWVCGDSRLKLSEAPRADFIFSCPPYGDLERYSDSGADISTLEYHDFLVAYRKIIRRCAKRLKPNRLACFVVGDFRDKKTGNYRGFVADTIYAFRDAGLELYNDAVLVTAVGSLSVRVTKQFEASRKLGKTHQNVLVFTNGKPARLYL